MRRACRSIIKAPRVKWESSGGGIRFCPSSDGHSLTGAGRLRTLFHVSPQKYIHDDEDIYAGDLILIGKEGKRESERDASLYKRRIESSLPFPLSRAGWAAVYLLGGGVRPPLMMTAARRECYFYQWDPFTECRSPFIRLKGTA